MRKTICIILVQIFVLCSFGFAVTESTAVLPHTTTPAYEIPRDIDNIWVDKGSKEMLKELLLNTPLKPFNFEEKQTKEERVNRSV